MRASTAVGGFLCAFALMVFVLHPVYRVPVAGNRGGLEATGPLEESRPIPEWVALAALGAGVALLVLGQRRRRR